MMDESEIVVAGEQAHVLIDALPYIDAEYVFLRHSNSLTPLRFKIPS